MTLLGDAHGREAPILGANIVADERPQVVVSKGVWQLAGPRDGWAFVGFIVAPAFRFEGFEMTPDGWELEHG